MVSFTSVFKIPKNIAMKVEMRLFLPRQRVLFGLLHKLWSRKAPFWFRVASQIRREGTTPRKTLIRNFEDLSEFPAKI